MFCWQRGWKRALKMSPTVSQAMRTLAAVAGKGAGKGRTLLLMERTKIAVILFWGSKYRNLLWNFFPGVQMTLLLLPLNCIFQVEVQGQLY